DGPAALPVLLDEIRDTDSARLQRTIPIALREIGDRRAVPYLIYALARCRADTGNNGMGMPDGELYWRMRRMLNPPVTDDYGSINDEQPDQVITAALEKLTNHREPRWHLSEYGENGDWPTIWDEANLEVQRQKFRRMADRWWVWWEANQKSLLSAGEMEWMAAHAPKNEQSPPSNAARSITITARDEQGNAVKDYELEVWADRARYAIHPDAAGEASVAVPDNAERVSIFATRTGA